MTYNEAIEFIKYAGRLGSKLGLETIGRLLEKLGNPQNNLKFIHIAGTNGKGSTCQYITNALMAAGFSVGSYISPFVSEFRERIQINGEYIPEDALAECVGLIREVCDENLRPTEFEIITAVGFLFFNMKKCDYVALEVGLGGRFDATNVILPPVAAVITSISIDHTELLGDTAAKIAFEKCGIIKNGCFVVCYPNQPAEAVDVIKDTATERGCPFFMPQKSEIETTAASLDGTEFRYKNRDYKIRLLGAHQVFNACTAIETLLRLGISEKHIRQGLLNTKFKARFEILKEKPLLIFDGAHNFDAISNFCDNIASYKGNKKLTIIMGMLSDKEYEKCIARTAAICDCFIAVTAPNPRALAAEKVAEIAGKNCKNVRASDDVKGALSSAVVSGELIAVCGSLYLYKDVELWLKEEEEHES